MTQSPESLKFSHKEIVDQVERILSSPHFHASAQRRSFLKFVVDQTLAGNKGKLKGYMVATQVFGRDTDFDQNLDPVVSIHAGKLRRAMERYYLTAGVDDPIRIDIPKGTYVPLFVKQSCTTPNTVSNKNPRMASAEDSWPTVTISPLKNVTGDSENDFLGLGFSTELAVEISRFQEIKTVYAPQARTPSDAVGEPQFVLAGTVQKDNGDIKVSLYLSDTTTGQQIWSDVHRCDLSAEQLINFQESVARQVAVKIADDHGVISRNLSLESKQKSPVELSTYEAILRYYEFDQSLHPKSMRKALEALHQAAAREPSCGQVWTLLGRLYTLIYALDLGGVDQPLERAIEYAYKGASINPNSQRSWGTLALAHLISDELTVARKEVLYALELNPNSLMSIDGLGYIMTLLGEWEKGTALIEKSIQNNPYYRNEVHYALWVDRLRRRDFQGAFMETMRLQWHEVFWYPLAKASTLGLLGRIGEGKKALGELLQFRPDFNSRGRTLIRHYIKFEGIIEKVVDGLAKVGMCLE
jgi:adenylate cyclase